MNFFKKYHVFELTLIALVMGVHLYAAFSAPHNFTTHWFTRDDAYYYFKVAQNISEGHGSSFDGINLTNGYHPLWMLICIPIFSLARYDLILPLRVLLVVMAALSVTTSILLFRLLKTQVGQPVAMLAASFWAFSLDVHSVITQQGMETGIVALSIVTFLVVLQRMEPKQRLEPRDLLTLGLAALFVLFSRLDGIYLILIAGVWLVFRRTALRYLLPLDLLATFSVIVLAFIQRATLKIYMLAYDSSAIAMAIVTFAIQTIIFYFIGLYERPGNMRGLRILSLSVLGVTLSTLISGLAMFSLAALSAYDLPKTVPLFYWPGMLLMTLLIRFGLKLTSPWTGDPSQQDPGVRVQVSGVRASSGMIALLASLKTHFLTALKPLAEWLRTSLPYFGLVTAGLAIYMGANLLLFGTPMPVSGQIKHWWGSLPRDVYGGPAKTVLDVFGIDPTYSGAWGLFTDQVVNWANKLSKAGWDFDATYWLMMISILLAGALLFLKKRKRNLKRLFLIGLFPLMVSAELHVFYYGAVAYASKHEWYWVMQMLSVVLLGALILSALFDLLPGAKPFQFMRYGLVSLASLYLAFTFSSELISRMPYQDIQADQPYVDIVPILESNTEPGAMIGMTGGGNTGYFIHDRTIVNMDGLINSYGYFTALRANQGGKYLAARGMDYIFSNRDIILGSMPYRDQFSADELSTVTGAPVYGAKELMRYKPVNK